LLLHKSNVAKMTFHALRHHTGQMWRALDLVQHRVAPNGCLMLALYNDAGGKSVRWSAIKRIYVAMPAPLRPAFAALAIAPIELRMAAGAALRGQPMEYVHGWTRYAEHKRGMSRWRDIVDWVGGYPYEYAKTDAIFAFYRQRGFTLKRLNARQVRSAATSSSSERRGQ
jgi:hypothetical protein